MLKRDKGASNRRAAGLKAVNSITPNVRVPLEPTHHRSLNCVRTISLIVKNGGRILSMGNECRKHYRKS
jgi:hypothetical protein